MPRTAELLVRVEHTQEAEDAYRALLEANPDKIDYYRALLKCKGLDLGMSHLLITCTGAAS